MPPSTRCGCRRFPFGGLSDLSPRFVILADALPSFGTYNCEGRRRSRASPYGGIPRLENRACSSVQRGGRDGGGQRGREPSFYHQTLSTLKQDVPLTRVKTAFPCSLYHLWGTAESDRPPGRGGNLGLPQVPVHGGGGSPARLLSARRFCRVVYRVTRPGGTAPGRSAKACECPERFRRAGPPGTRQRGRFFGFASRACDVGGRRIRWCALDCERS